MYAKAIEASDERIVAEFSLPASAYEEITGHNAPKPTDLSSVKEALAEIRTALNDYADQERDIDGKKTTLNQVKSELDAGWAAANNIKAQLDEASAALDGGWSELNALEEQLDSARAQVEEGEQQLEDAKKQLKDAKKQVKDGQKTVDEKSDELDSAKHKLEDMKDRSWSVLSRSNNGGVGSARQLSSIMRNLSYSMAALFVIVGLLVCYSAVGRIVHEQITQIGTKKALGLRFGEITMSFLSYSGLSVIFGSLIGLALSVFVVERIIGHTLSQQFIMGDYPPYFDVLFGLGVTFVELALVLLATWLACRAILSRNAVDLLRGEEPPSNKARFFEKWGLWENLPLYTQTIVNNCLNDKRRVFSTIVGVAGCTALIVTAITLNDDVLNSYDKQYDEVFGFDAVAYAKSDESGALSEMSAALEEQGCSSCALIRQKVTMQKANGEYVSVTLTVPSDEDAMDVFYRIKLIGSGSSESSALSDTGVYVSYALHDHQGVEVGDILKLPDSDGAMHDFTVEGFYEFYLPENEMVMSRALYEQELGDNYKPNALLVNTGGKDFESLQAALSSIDGYMTFENDKEMNRVNFDSFSSVSRSVVIIYLVLSVLMAIIVLLNLNVMFIEEKKRELIVLMINGFSVKDAKRYIYNDTIVLSAIGIVVGLVLGSLTGSLSVASVEPETASFFKGIDWVAIAAGIGVSAVLAFAMSAIALRRIPAFSLTDINKL